MWPKELAEFLLFRGLTSAQQAQLAPMFSHVNFKEGEVIFEQGDPADTAYILEDGVVALQLRPEGKGLVTIATLYRGGILGWSAILGHALYLTSAICTAESRALAVPGAKLLALIRGEPEFSILLGRMALAVAERRVDAPFQVESLLDSQSF